MINTLVFIDVGFLSKLSKYFGKGNYLQNKKFYKVLNYNNFDMLPGNHLWLPDESFFSENFWRILNG